MTEELRGLLAVGVLPEILRRIFVAERTGVLHAAFGSERADFEFVDGRLTHAEATMPGVHLGDLLIQIGFLGARDRDAAMEIAALSEERLGATLLRHGLLDADHLAQGLALQLREVLARTMIWGGGVYTFTDSVGPTDASDGLRAHAMDPREVIFDATWTLVGDPAIDGFLGDVTQKLKKVSDEFLMSLSFRLSPAEALLLSQVDGQLSASGLLQLSPVANDEAKASVAGLLLIGAIEYVGAPPPTSATAEITRFEVARLAARITSSDPYEVLGVAPSAEMGEVRSTYLRLLRLCDPASTADSGFRSILRRMSGQLADAFKDIERRRGTPAPELLKKPPPRRSSAPPLRALAKSIPPPSAPAAPPLAAPSRNPSEANEAAAQSFEAGRVQEALAILHEAMPHLAGRARRSARLRRARILLSIENGAKLAEEELKAAISEDPGSADAHVVLGGIYGERGSHALAMMEYRKALDLEPRNASARDALQQLKTAPTEKPPVASVLKRLFGR